MEKTERMEKMKLNDGANAGGWMDALDEAKRTVLFNLLCRENALNMSDRDAVRVAKRVILGDEEVRDAP